MQTRLKSRAFAVASVLALGLAALPAPVFAQEAAPDSTGAMPAAESNAPQPDTRIRVGATDAAVVEELRALRRTAEQQSKQLDAIAQQLTRLNQHLSGGGQSSPDLGSQPVSSPTASASVSEAATAAPPAPGVPAGDATAKPEPPTAPAVPGPKHTVAKGETLTSIAKRYNIPIPELQKANNIKDDRKLQIGQVLTLPAGTQTPAPQQPSEPSTTSTDKKETR